MKRIVRMNQMFLRRVGLSVGLGLLFLGLCIAPAMAERVVLPESLTEIADEAFLNNASITSVEIPFGAERIGARAFAGCENLEEIIVPATVREIDEDAFSGCDELTILCRSGSAAEKYASQYGIAHDSYEITAIPEGLQYTVSDTYATITGYSGSATKLILPDVIEGKTVTTIGSSAFEGNSQLANVSLPYYLTTIRSYAFAYCTSLRSIVLPDSITTMEAYAFGNCDALVSVNYPLNWSAVWTSNYRQVYSPFYNCDSLANVVIPEGVTSVPAYAFKDSCISSVSFPSTLKSINESAFRNTHLISVSIPEGASSIGDSAFRDCKYLMSVIIDEGLTTIDGYAFASCTQLTSVSLPDTLTTIRCYAFEYCTSLTSIVLPDSVTMMEAYAFGNCDALVSVNYPLNWSAVWTSSYHRESSPFYNCDSLADIVIPEGVTTIPAYAFRDSCISSVSFPSTLKNINESAFRNTHLISVSIPEGASSIGDSAFRDCKYLTSVIIDEGLTSIGDYAFASCVLLANVSLPDTLTTICNHAFEYCTSLTSIVLPDSITTMEWYAFKDCDALIDVNYPANWAVVDTENAITSDEYSPFYNCDSLTDIVIPDGVTSIPAYAFKDSCISSVSFPSTLKSIKSSAFCNTHLTSISIPEGASSIGDYAFDNCQYLTSVIIEEGLTSIGQCAFSSCAQLTSVSLPDTLTTIRYSAFENCTSLRSIVLPDSITTIESYAFRDCDALVSVNYPLNWSAVTSNYYVQYSPFYNCDSLADIVIPEGVTSVPAYAFKDSCVSSVSFPSTLKSINTAAFQNTHLTSISIHEGASSIGEDAFRDCKYLTSVIVDEGLTSIGDYAFASCARLTNVSLPDTLITICFSAFEYCTSLRSIVLPDSITTMEAYAFGNCDALVSVNYPLNWSSLYRPGFSVWPSPFHNCDSLTSIVIPEGVTSIPTFAFAYSLLLQAYVPGSVTSIGSSAFAYLPDGFVMYGVSGSYAETYAAENGLSFIPGRIPTADYGDTDAVFTITVLTPDGMPADRATVQAYASDNDMLVGSAVTDESGVCSISGLQKGRLYYFVCRKAPFSFADTYESTDTQSASVTIRANPMNEAYALASPASATIDAAGGSAEFAVSASGAWTVSCDADWLTLSTAGGSDGALLTVTAAANTGYLRAAEVLLNTENVTTAFYVYQTGDLGARLPDPVITSPAENDMILPYGDVTISWDPVEGAEEYAVSLRDLDTDTLMLFHESQKDATSVTFPAGYLNGDCRYRVAVAAVPAGATTKDSVTSWRERTFAVSAQEVPGTSSLSGYVYELITPEAVAAYAVRTSSISSDTKDAVVRAAASADGLDTSPLANVTVTVMTEVDQTIVGTATTDAEGYWIMPELTPGESYRIELKKDGFAFRVAYFRYDTVPGENAVKPIYAYDENMDYEGAIGTLLISYDDQLKMNGSIREHGLFAEYFQYSNSKKFVAAEKRNEGIVDNIDFSWKGDVNDDVSGVSYRELKVYDFEDEGKGTHKEIIDYVPQKFSARFNGYLMVRDPEAYAGMTWYKFRVRGDDGVRLIMRTDDYTQLPGKYEDWGNGSNNVATAEPEGMLYVNQVLSVTIEYYNHEGWFDKSNLIFEYSKDYGVSDKDSTWYTVPTDWLYCGNRTVEVSDVAGANYALRLLEANKKIADYSKTTIQDFVELIADEMIGGKVIDMYSELNGSGKLAGSYLETILNNINETIGDEVAEAVYEAVGMGVAGTMTEETMWQQIWTNVCGIGGDLVEDWFDPGMSQGIDNMNNLVKLTAYLKNLKNQDDLLDRIWGAVQNIPEFNTDNMGEISRDNIFLALIVGESKEDNIFSDAVYDSIKSANKEIKSILDLCEKGNELLKSVGGLDQSNEARAMLYLMDLESKGTQYNGWIMNLFDSALSLAEEDRGDTFWKTFNRDTIKADLRNLNSIPNKNITRLLARIRGVDLTQTLYKEVLLMTMDATRSYYTTMFKGLIKN